MEKRVVVIVREIVVDEPIRALIVIGGVDAGNEDVTCSLIGVMTACERQRSVDVNKLLASIVDRVIEDGIMIVFVEDIDVHFCLTGLVVLMIEGVDGELVERSPFAIQFTGDEDSAVVRVDGEG